MRLNVLCPLLLALGLGFPVFADTPAVDPADLTARQFLDVARRPFLQNAWAKLAGTVQFKNDRESTTLPLSLSVLMHADYLRAQFILDGKDVYDVMQAYSEEGMSNVRIDLPERVSGPPLSDLGISVSDITFSFLYWDFQEELKGRKVRGQACRVMRLRNPQNYDEVVVCFSAKYVGPMRVEYFAAGRDTPSRWLEFTDFERKGDLYYVTAAQLRGEGWKTQIKFKDATIALSAETPPPEELFVRPNRKE